MVGKSSSILRKYNWKYKYTNRLHNILRITILQYFLGVYIIEMSNDPQM